MIETLSIYFLGTTFEACDSLNSLETRGYQELIGQLFLENSAEIISLSSNNHERKIKNEFFAIRKNNEKQISSLPTNQSTSINPNQKSIHYKILVNGVGSNSEKSLISINGFSPNEILKQGSGLGFANKKKRTVEAVKNLISPQELNNKIPKEKNSKENSEKIQIKTVNLFGFSRGAVTAIEVANELAKIDEIENINIFAVDPVYGSIINYSPQLTESNKINMFIGIYAVYEESYLFNAIIPLNYKGVIHNIPHKNNHAFFLPCLHETLVGNSRQYWAKSKKPRMTPEQENIIKPITEFVYTLASLISLYWKIPLKKIPNINPPRIYFEELNNSLIEICSSEKISNIMETIAPKSRYVPNPGGLIAKKYIFSDKNTKTINEISADIYKLPHNNKLIHEKPNKNAFLISFNWEALDNLMKKNYKMPLIKKRLNHLRNVSF